MQSFRNPVIALAAFSALLVSSGQALQAAKAETQYLLLLDGGYAGVLPSVEGGGISAEVINEPVGPDGYVRKHIGPPNYEEITLKVGAGSSSLLFDWVRATLERNYLRKSGSIIRAVNGFAVAEMEFQEALITELSFPGLSTRSKGLGYITVKFAPELIRFKKGNGEDLSNWLKDATLDTRLSEAEFRLTINGLDTSAVNKIEALVLKSEIVESPIGDGRDYVKEPSYLCFPNLVVYLAEDSPSAESFRAWHKLFLSDGNNTQTDEKSGALEYFLPGSTAAALTVNVSNLGIFSLATEKSEDGTLQVKAQMYCETMQLAE